MFDIYFLSFDKFTAIQELDPTLSCFTKHNRKRLIPANILNGIERDTAYQNKGSCGILRKYDLSYNEDEDVVRSYHICDDTCKASAGTYTELGACCPDSKTLVIYETNVELSQSPQEMNNLRTILKALSKVMPLKELISLPLFKQAVI